MNISRRELIALLGAGALGSSRSWAAQPEGKTYGVALVGLGSYATGQLGPALLETKRARLTGIVTGSPEKIPSWREKYGVAEGNVYSYENFDEIADNKDIDVIYIVLPPGMHAEYSIRAAEAGKHVICEKPMAATVEECDAMIAAAKKNKVGLHIGYRLHWDPYHQRLMEVARTEEMGKLKDFSAALAYQDRNPKAWKLSKKLGVAGELYNLGTYPVQAALYTVRENPIRVTATSHNARPELFTETPEGYDWVFEFPGGVKASGFASSAKSGNFLKADAEKGGFGLDQQAFAYGGIGGYVGEKRMNFPEVNQQALQIDGMCASLDKGEKGLAPGEMGRRDVALLQAIMKSAETGKPVEIGDLGYPAV
ncbi:Gfo/Idh/MocA family protein [Luteolibacter algae]